MQRAHHGEDSQCYSTLSFIEEIATLSACVGLESLLTLDHPVCSICRRTQNCVRLEGAFYAWANRQLMELNREQGTEQSLAHSALYMHTLHRSVRTSSLKQGWFLCNIRDEAGFGHACPQSAAMDANPICSNTVRY